MVVRWRGKLRAATAVVACMLCLYPVAAMAAQDIGEASEIANQVTGTVEESLRQLVVGDHIFQNEWIETAEASSAEFMFIDESIITFGPLSRVRLDTFIFDPDPALGKVVINMTEGAFRFATGSMRSSAYEIHTPTAIIGVRGTEIEVVVDPVDNSTTLRLISGTAFITNCPKGGNLAADADDTDPCAGGVTRILDQPDQISKVSAADLPPSLPILFDQAFEDRIDEMDEILIAAIAAEFETAAGGDTFELIELIDVQFTESIDFSVNESQVGYTNN